MFYKMDIILRTDEKQHYTGKKIPVLPSHRSILFTSLVKAVCKTDQKGEMSLRIWTRLEPKLTENVDFQAVAGAVFVNANTVKILVKDNMGACKKTWGLFTEDGFDQLFQDMTEGTIATAGTGECSKKRKKSQKEKATVIAEPAGEEESSEEELGEEDPSSLIKQREDMAVIRERLIGAQTGLLLKRE